MPKIILFNGPPRSGKDTATFIACASVHNAVHYRFASPLKRAVHELFGLKDVPEEMFNKRKSDHQDLMHGMTPREAYIWMSEEVARPKFGQDFFARSAVTAITKICQEKGSDVVIISDCGFQIEVDHLVDSFGEDNLSVVRLMRNDRTFENDSRGYVEHPVPYHNYIVMNNGTMKQFKDSVIKVVGDILCNQGKAHG